MDNKNLKILSVEDNPGDARLIVEYLLERNFCEGNIDTAQLLEEAKVKLSHTNYNAILLDLTLPDSSRNNTVKNIFELVEDIPVIIISGTRDEISAIDSIKSGVQDFLIKDEITPDSLSRAVNNAILRSNIEKELRHLNKFKDNLLSILSHDLRSPFNALIGYIDLTLLDLESLSKDEIQDNLVEVKNISFTLLSFIENLLTWSRLQGDCIHAEPQNFNLSELEQKSLPTIKLAAKAKEIEIKYRDLEKYNVFADIDMVDTVLRNIISNAIKYSTEKSVIILDITVNDQVAIKVTDTGMGMDSELLENIFQPDRRVLQKGTRNERGHGLGLIICKEFVKINGGTLLITSELGKGTEITITIPKAKV